MFPGPLIEANEGDEIVVHVTNHLDIGMTIHWHGMFQNGTQFMDGVPGISQVGLETVPSSRGLTDNGSARSLLVRRLHTVSEYRTNTDRTGGTRTLAIPSQTVSWAV